MRAASLIRTPCERNCCTAASQDRFVWCALLLALQFVFARAAAAPAGGNLGTVRVTESFDIELW